MKEVSMGIDWRTIQFFIDENGVHEVQLDYYDRKKVRCSCQEFQNAAKCQHSKFIRKSLDNNNGVFKLDIPEHVDEDYAFEQLQDPDAFRDFILKYGKVLVLP